MEVTENEILKVIETFRICFSSDETIACNRSERRKANKIIGNKDLQFQ